MARDVRGTGARIEAGDEERKAAWDGFTVPTKYWHVVDEGVSSATCARAPASFARANAACVSCGAGYRIRWS
jgi:hypothetical protein